MTLNFNRSYYDMTWCGKHAVDKLIRFNSWIPSQVAALFVSNQFSCNSYLSRSYKFWTPSRLTPHFLFSSPLKSRITPITRTSVLYWKGWRKGYRFIRVNVQISTTPSPAPRSAMLTLSVLLLSLFRSAELLNATEKTPGQNTSSLANQTGSSLVDDVRWLQFVTTFQTQLTLNSTITNLPMCTTWLSNNHQTTRSLNKTISNLEKWGKHCVSNIDCITGQLSFQNQGLSITDQLNAGVRRLVLELHYVPNMKRKLRLCASLQGGRSVC